MEDSEGKDDGQLRVRKGREKDTKKKRKIEEQKWAEAKMSK